MSHTITVRLTKELAEWLEQTAGRMGVSQGQIIREQLERAVAESSEKSFLRLAGVKRGPRDLSSRKGFSRE
jgi:predicted DNA-binding protein